VLWHFVNEQLNLSQLAVSLRVQPETVRGLNNGVVVLKFFSKYFDVQRSNTKKKGVLSASYIHRLTSNWCALKHASLAALTSHLGSSAEASSSTSGTGPTAATDCALESAT
jgi:hypothetical protein